MRQPENFEKFYMSKVALGEACGRAEKIIDDYEFNRTGGARAGRGLQRRRPGFSLNAFPRKYGLSRRPKSPD